MRNRWKILLFFIITLAPNILYAFKAINLNTSTQEEMIYLAADKAKKIIEYRVNNNGFSNIDELDKIFEKKFIDRIHKTLKIYAVSEQVWNSRVTENPLDLKNERLIIKTFSLEGEAIYLELPDGGNILINTGSESDADKLILILKNEIISGKRFKIMDAFGWKPRIDWLILTDVTEDKTGGLENLFANFNVREVITSVNSESILNSEAYKKLQSVLNESNIIQTNLIDNAELDLQQTIAHIRLFAVGPGYYNDQTGLCLRLEYSDLSFLHIGNISDTVSDKINRDFDGFFKATFLNAGNLSEKIRNKITVKFMVNSQKTETIVTDGYLIFKKKGIVKLPLNRKKHVSIPKNKNTAEKNFRNAMGYYGSGSFYEARELLKKAEKIDNEYIKDMEEIMFQHAKLKFNMNEFKRARLELDKILFINRKNKKASQLLERIKETLNLVE